MAVVPRSDLGPPLAALDDSRLVALASDGDQRAFEQLVQRHRRRLLARARRVLPGDRAEDALQSGLLSAWVALQRGTDVQDARPWLERIVHNAALRALPPAVHAELSETIGAPSEDEPAATLDRRQQLRDALAALALLPELQREALLQTAIEGDSYESVARSLGLRQTTVRGLVHRARTAMRTALGALIPLPGLGRLLGRRAPAAGRSDAAAHAATSATSGGVGAIAAKGAIALVVAAAGVGTAQIVARSGSVAHGHREPAGVALVGSGGPRATSPAAAAFGPRSPAQRRPRGPIVIRLTPAHRDVVRSGALGAVSGLLSPGVAARGGGATAGPAVREPAASRPPTSTPGPIPVTAGGSPVAPHHGSPPAQGGQPAPATPTRSTPPPSDPSAGSSSGSGADGGGDTSSTDTTAPSTEASTTSSDPAAAVASAGQPGS